MRVSLALLVVLACGAACGIGPLAFQRQTAAEEWIETELMREPFDAATWRKRWLVEGGAELSVRDGRLSVVTLQATLWLRQPLPTDVAIELKAGVDAPAENNAANLNLIVHARERDGTPYRFGRSAQYEQYHVIPNYIATLTGGFREGWSRLRRNPGFTILSEEVSTRSEVGRSYRIRLLVAGGRIRYWLDGKLIHDAVDPQPLPGGHLALRTWRSRVWWSDIRVAALKRSTKARD
jgi:Domain of unknown function (DUF6250)